jgi:hypothetical protein
MPTTAAAHAAIEAKASYEHTMTEASQGDRPLLALVEEMALDDEEEVPLPHTHPAAPAPLAQKSEETAVLWHYVPLDDVPALVRNDPLPSARAALVLPPAQVIPQQRQKRGRRGHGMRKKQRSPAARHGGGPHYFCHPLTVS